MTEHLRSDRSLTHCLLANGASGFKAAATGAANSCSMAGNVIVTMLASSWPMNAPKQTTLTASHGARRLSRTRAGRACSRKILL